MQVFLASTYNHLELKDGLSIFFSKARTALLKRSYGGRINIEILFYYKMYSIRIAQRQVELTSIETSFYLTWIRYVTVFGP